MVVVLALVLLGGLVWGVFALADAVFGGDDAPPDATPTSTVEAETSGEESTQPVGESEQTDDATPTPTEPAIGETPPLPTSCTPTDATLSVAVPTAAPAGTAVSMTVSVEVDGGQPCLVDLGSGSLVIEVFSGEDRIWSSQQCGFEPASRELLIPSGASDEQPWVWPGWRSNDECAAPAEGEAWAQPGTYRVVATHTREGQVLTGESGFIVQ